MHKWFNLRVTKRKCKEPNFVNIPLTVYTFKVSLCNRIDPVVTNTITNVWNRGGGFTWSSGSSCPTHICTRLHHFNSVHSSSSLNNLSEKTSAFEHVTPSHTWSFSCFYLPGCVDSNSRMFKDDVCGLYVDKQSCCWERVKKCTH